MVRVDDASEQPEPRVRRDSQGSCVDVSAIRCVHTVSTSLCVRPGPLRSPDRPDRLVDEAHFVVF